MKTDMIKKLWVSIITNKLVSIGFVSTSYVLVIAYHAEQWLWVIFFAIALVLHISQLARASTTYDTMKWKGRI